MGRGLWEKIKKVSNRQLVAKKLENKWDIAKESKSNIRSNHFNDALFYHLTVVEKIFLKKFSKTSRNSS